MIGRKTISNDLAWNACVVLTAPPSSLFESSVFEIRSFPVSIGWWKISRRVVKRLKQESYCNLQDDDINKNKNKNNNNNNRKTTFKGHFLKWLSMPFFWNKALLPISIWSSRFAGVVWIGLKKMSKDVCQNLDLGKIIKHFIQTQRAEQGRTWCLNGKCHMQEQNTYMRHEKYQTSKYQWTELY